MKLCILAYLLSPVVAGPDILAWKVNQKLAVHRDFVEPFEAQTLPETILSSCLPHDDDEEEAPNNSFVKYKGDAGSQVSTPDVVPSLENIRSIIYGASFHETTSVVVLLEHMFGSKLSQIKESINNVVPNKVLEDGGTIHMYMSPPGIAALGNHSDTTDIFVLQLEGEKSWLLCEENELEQVGFGDRLNSCSTYNEEDINRMKCKQTVLRPGDAMYLPRRVVHSARALDSKPSVHLTFGFSPNQCLEGEKPRVSSSQFLRKMQGSQKCTAVEGGLSCDAECTCTEGCDSGAVQCNEPGLNCNCSGGCDEDCAPQCRRECNDDCDADCDGQCGIFLRPCSCDENCDGSCTTICTTPKCNADQGGSSCDNNCQFYTSSCDENCNCEGDCDICPSTPAPAPIPTKKPTAAPVLTPPSPPDEDDSFSNVIMNSLCFSGETIVEVQGKGNILMSQLRIGDDVAQVGGGHSKVYSFGHRHEKLKTTFIQIFSEGNQTKPLEVSPDHLVFVRERTNKNSPKHLVAAKHLQIGQYLITKDGSLSEITSLGLKDRIGIYAPLTRTGSLLASGVEASSYVSLDWIPTMSDNTFAAWIQHIGTTPLRLLYSCYNWTDETYDDQFGFNWWVLFWWRSGQVIVLATQTFHSNAVSIALSMTSLAYYLNKKPFIDGDVGK